ncbi:hypothetical protein [Sporosarcina sp. ZBG7A]|uniref:hypothetical protein n=1 Tax=Sporosarcina sp. ZBG7A TaxID=1582223 RepID=UPI000579F84A|nr:hypothetical protein [Sporosarcina sp. ZBG7A]
MKVTSNERGYALLIVLLLVVLIMSISAVFMRGAISNAKQEQRVDKNHLSVVSAEMGVDYYATSFTNRYYEVKDRVWETTVAEFKAAMADKNFDGNVTKLAKFYDDRMKNELRIAFDEVEHMLTPTGTSFKLESEKFDINYTVNPIAIEGNIEGHYLDGKESILKLSMEFDAPSVLAKGSGEDVEVEEPKEDPLPDGGLPSLTYKPFTIPQVDPIDHLNITKEVDIISESNNQKTRTVYKKENINSNENVQGYGKSVSMQSHGNITLGKLYGNNNVDIRSNGEFSIGQIQANTGYLTLISKGNISSSNFFNVNNNVTIRTGGNFAGSSQLDSNTGFLDVQVKGNMSSSSVSNNPNVNILTNGNYTTGDMWKNDKRLSLKVEGNIIAEKIHYNENTNIETKGNFTSKLINKNTPAITIKTDKNFTSEKIQDNNKVDIQAKGDFQASGLEKNLDSLNLYVGGNFNSTEQLLSNNYLNLYSGGNVTINGVFNSNTPAKVYAKGNYTSGNVQGNSNLDMYSGGNVTINGVLNSNVPVKIQSKKNFTTGNMQSNSNLEILSGGDFTVNGFMNYNLLKTTIITKNNFVSGQIQENPNLTLSAGGNIDVGGILYGNTKSRLFSKGNITTKNIQNNSNFKMVALGNLNAENVYLKSDSLVCVGGNFIRKSLSMEPGSRVYMKGMGDGSPPGIVYLKQKDWEKVCAFDVEIPEEDDDVPKVEVSVDGGWKRPLIEVEYNPVTNKK